MTKVTNVQELHAECMQALGEEDEENDQQINALFRPWVDHFDVFVDTHTRLMELVDSVCIERLMTAPEEAKWY